MIRRVLNRCRKCAQVSFLTNHYIPSDSAKILEEILDEGIISFSYWEKKSNIIHILPMKESLYDSHHLYCKKIIPMGLKLAPQNREGTWSLSQRQKTFFFCSVRGKGDLKGHSERCNCMSQDGCCEEKCFEKVEERRN